MKTDFIEKDDGRELHVGDIVVARDAGEYEGLLGEIIEITDTDETGNPGDYDVHCAFMPPVLKHEQKELERVFSDLYQMEKKLEDISLDDVIMSPEELYPVQHSKTTEIYVFGRSVERPDDENCKHTEDYYSMLDEARWNMRKALEADGGAFLSAWKQEAGFYEEEVMENHYSAGVKDQGKRYSVYVKPIRVVVDELFAKELVEKFQ